VSEHYPKLRLTYEDGHLLVREGLSLCFYMQRSHAEVSQAVTRALHVYLQAVGPTAVGRYANSEGEWQDLDAAGWERVETELSGRRSRNLVLHDAEDARYAYRFEYYGRPVGDSSLENTPGVVCAARFWLPTEYLEEHGPERVSALAGELALLLPFSSGHGGLAFNGDLDVVGMMRQVHQHCFRHPGVDLLELEHVSWELGHRVRGPSWLTFLGQPALGGLGGVAGLRNQLRSPGTTVEELGEGRALITLGTWPEAGDTEQGHTLPAYRELARVLEPWRFQEEHPYSLGFTPEQLQRWERRFLD
jgi:hypothetical protein